MMRVDAAQVVARLGDQGHGPGPARGLVAGGRVGEDVDGDLKVGQGDAKVVFAVNPHDDLPGLAVQLERLGRPSLAAPLFSENREQFSAHAVADAAELLEPGNGSL